MLQGLAQRFDVETQTLWTEIRAVTLGRIDLQQLVLATLGGFASVGITVFLVVIYAGFLDRRARDVPGQDLGRADRCRERRQDPARHYRHQQPDQPVPGRQGRLIKPHPRGEFPFRSCGCSMSISPCSGPSRSRCLNYIPYVGSYLGVAFPVILSLGQFASLQTTLILLVLLVAAQTWVGKRARAALDRTAIEHQPLRGAGRPVGLGPRSGAFPGAILAIPMTSILIIVTSNFDQTRFHRGPAVRARQIRCPASPFRPMRADPHQGLPLRAAPCQMTGKAADDGRDGMRFLRGLLKLVIVLALAVVVLRP